MQSQQQHPLCVVRLSSQHTRHWVFLRLLRLAVALAFSVAISWAQKSSPASSLLVSNNDEEQGQDTVNFFAIGDSGTLTSAATVATGFGTGSQLPGGGDFAANRVIVVAASPDLCVFVTRHHGQDITGIQATSHAISGHFFAASSHTGYANGIDRYANGIGLAANTEYVYASYSGFGTIGTFKIEPGCKLRFLGDLLTVGLQNGWVTGMAIHGGLMVVTYGDGSIESFNISQGQPVSNGDLQNSTGFQEDHIPNGIDITRDGRFAIFGDASTVTTVEVSDISSGKLTPTVVYHLGDAANSSNVRLSPDESTLFISNNSSGQVTAAFFDKENGKLSPGCTSATLKNFYAPWEYAGNIGLQLATGAGGYLYIPEYGSPPSIGVVRFAAMGTNCTLTEVASVPAGAGPSDGSALPLSVEVFPLRSF